jgi:hypothetical protein
MVENIKRWVTFRTSTLCFRELSSNFKTNFHLNKLMTSLKRWERKKIMRIAVQCINSNSHLLQFYINYFKYCCINNYSWTRSILVAWESLFAPFFPVLSINLCLINETLKLVIGKSDIYRPFNLYYWLQPQHLNNNEIHFCALRCLSLFWGTQNR